MPDPGQGVAGGTTAPEPPKAPETLSQFVARVLDQLSLSAWLPSAALVLLLALVFRLASELDAERPRGRGVGQVVGAAFASLAGLSPGGALLLLLAVVVTTIVTQAFAFEAIRTLEGYWGTSAPIERLAEWRCSRFRRRLGRFETAYDRLTSAAWASARSMIEREQADAIRAGDDEAEVREWTPDMLAYLGAKLQTLSTDAALAPDVRRRALNLPWERYAPADLLRRQVNVDKRLRDFPLGHRVLPTRLGNVLRAHEDQTGHARVETFVLEAYDQLPTTLRTQHDEHRNRLDLYCSMVFVVAFVACVAVARLAAHPPWAAAAAVTGLLVMWLTYRAALASARIYGLLILEVARRFPPP